MKMSKEQIMKKAYQIKRIMEFDLDLLTEKIDELDENGVSFDLLDDITAPIEHDLEEMKDYNNELIKEMEQNY